MEDVKFFHSDDYASVNLKPFEVHYGDIIVAMSGATTGKIGTYKHKHTAYLNQRTGKFVPQKQILNRYLYHFLSTKVNELYNMAGGGAQPNLSSRDIVEKIIIPIPPLTEQRRIVEILDKFDELVNGLTSGLPAEIKMRQQQYEYYRDKIFGSLQ